MNRDEKKCPGFRNVRDRRDLMTHRRIHGDLLSMNRPCTVDDEDGTVVLYLRCENTRSLRKVRFLLLKLRKLQWHESSSRSTTTTIFVRPESSTDPEMVGEEVARACPERPAKPGQPWWHLSLRRSLGVSFIFNVIWQPQISLNPRPHPRFSPIPTPPHPNPTLLLPSVLLPRAGTWWWRLMYDLRLWQADACNHEAHRAPASPEHSNVSSGRAISCLSQLFILQILRRL